jgi:sterol desaturase/sphingolipid hydroxylase (fatty acid hydroxylase superfamily)
MVLSRTAVAIWTLLEYLLHRFVLHRIPTFARMHAVHHASPRAFVGTPTWVSLLTLWIAIFVPAWRTLSLHHHAEIPGNFGVTTRLWDRLFGTEQPRASAK